MAAWNSGQQAAALRLLNNHSAGQVSLARPLVRPVHFRSVNVAQPASANIRWASAEAVNFMDHLYFITNLALDYLLEDQLPSQLLNQTLFSDPLSLFMDHRNELIAHFHKLLILACACLCVGISIPLFGFMIACCWCSTGSTSSNNNKSHHHHHHPKRHHRHQSAASRYAARPSSRSRQRAHGASDTADWLHLTSRDSGSGAGPSRSAAAAASSSSSSSSRHQRELDRRRRHDRNRRRTNANSSSSSGLSTNSGGAGGHRSRSNQVPASLRYETACHPCLRTLFSSNLFLLLLLVSFFAICAFVTNEYVDNGVRQLPRALNQTMDEIQVYLNNTNYEVDNLFRVNYQQLKGEINQRLDQSGVIIKHKLAMGSEAIAVVNLTDMVLEFNDTRYRLERIDRELTSLKSRLRTVKQGLADSRRKIENCSMLGICTLLDKKYQRLDNFNILPRYENLPDVKPLIKKISELLDNGIIQQVQKGRENFDRFALTIQKETDQTSPDIKKQLNEIESRLANLADHVSLSIRKSDNLFNHTKSGVRRLDRMSQYEQYRRYACLAGASVILFILLSYLLGWLYGSCRPQPTQRTYKTKIKTSASASFPFSCGIFTVFLLFLPLILGAIILLMTGSIGDKIVCQVVQHPEQKQSKQVYAMLQNEFLNNNLSVSSPYEDKVTLEQIDGKEYRVYRPNYADLMARCHQNLSIFKVLKLDQYDRVYLYEDANGKRVSIGQERGYYLSSTSAFKTVTNFEAKMKAFVTDLKLDTSKVELLSREAEKVLKLSTSISFDDIEASLTKLYDNGVSITQVNIEQLIKDVQAQKATLTGTDTEAELDLILIMIGTFTSDILPNITNSLQSLKDGVRHMKLRMFRGSNSFGAVVNELLLKVRNAEIQLRSNGRDLVKSAATEFTDELNALVDQYANHVKNQVENVIGQCEPVSRALNATTSTFCDDIILPFNGYWISAAASLILILPATFLAYALRGLYKLAKRGPSSHHNYSYTDQEDEISYEDDCEEVALAYQLGHHNQLSHKPSGSSAVPSAPMAVDDGWSPTSQSYVHNSRPPPYAV